MSQTTSDSMQDSKCANLHNNRNQILLVAILQSNQQQFYQEMCSINESYSMGIDYPVKNKTHACYQKKTMDFESFHYL